jgi:hypothetical protein
MNSASGRSREMSEMDAAARGEPGMVPRKSDLWAIACLVVPAVLFLLVAVGIWAYFSIGGGIVGAILSGL